MKTKKSLIVISSMGVLLILSIVIVFLFKNNAFKNTNTIIVSNFPHEIKMSKEVNKVKDLTAEFIYVDKILNEGTRLNNSTIITYDDISYHYTDIKDLKDKIDTIDLQSINSEYVCKRVSLVNINEINYGRAAFHKKQSGSITISEEDVLYNIPKKLKYQNFARSLKNKFGETVKIEQEYKLENEGDYMQMAILSPIFIVYEFDLLNDEKAYVFEPFTASIKWSKA